jgi:DNA-binding NarL/FixJ family response regulator
MSIRILLVEDFEPWRRFVCSMVEKELALEIVGEVSDGLVAVDKASELKPDLILLDIGLPRLNGLEAARQISKISPKPKILFVSQESSPTIVQEAMRIGSGFIVKTKAFTELLPAISAVMLGKRFLSRSLNCHTFKTAADAPLLTGVEW